MTAAKVVPFRFESHEVRTVSLDGNPAIPGRRN